MTVDLNQPKRIKMDGAELKVVNPQLVTIKRQILMNLLIGGCFAPIVICLVLTVISSGLSSGGNISNNSVFNNIIYLIGTILFMGYLAYTLIRVTRMPNYTFDAITRTLRVSGKNSHEIPFDNINLSTLVSRSEPITALGVMPLALNLKNGEKIALGSLSGSNAMQRFTEIEEILRLIISAPSSQRW